MEDKFHLHSYHEVNRFTTLNNKINKGPYIPKGIQASAFEKMWALNLTGKGIIVAVLDTGIDSTHSELRDQVLERYNFTEGQEPITDSHGTHVAGTICANGSLLRGGAYEAKLLDMQIIGKNGGSVKGVVKGIEQAVKSGATIINMSIGTDTLSKEDHRLISQAVTYAWNNGCLCISASGNSGTSINTIDGYEYPASISKVQGVGSCDITSDFQKIIPSTFSNENNAVGFGAVGNGVISCILNNEFAEYSGTSMATPHVSAMGAILAQYVRQIYPKLKGQVFSATLLSLMRQNVKCLTPDDKVKEGEYLHTSCGTCEGKMVSMREERRQCLYNISVGHGFIKFVKLDRFLEE